MEELLYLNLLHVGILSLEDVAAELHLVGVTGTQFTNTKGLEVKNYNSMMASQNQELYKEGIGIKYEKFNKFACFQQTLKTGMIPDEEVADGTLASCVNQMVVSQYVE